MESINNGVCGHSSDLYWKEKVVFSIDDWWEKSKPFISRLARHDMWVKELIGHYDGCDQASYVMLADDFFSDEFPMEFLTNQKSVLHLSTPEKKYNGRPTGTLLFNELYYTVADKGIENELGKFTHVTQREAIDNGDYTFDPSTASYFICKED